MYCLNGLYATPLIIVDSDAIDSLKIYRGKDCVGKFIQHIEGGKCSVACNISTGTNGRAQ